MNIPAIGGARGIFEIFVPGMFLLLNLAVAVSLFPFAEDDVKKQIVVWLSNPVFSLMIVIGFGYLIGVILRMLRTELADRWSGRCLRICDPKAYGKRSVYNSYAYEDFPYVDWLGIVCQRSLPPEAYDFYNKIWAKKDRTFFNFCKIMIISHDQRAANEIYSAEALTRYIAEMFYALAIASFLILVTIILHYVVSHNIMITLMIMLFVYILAIIGILKNLRFIRIKEVQTVFAASFKNRSIFEKNS